MPLHYRHGFHSRLENLNGPLRYSLDILLHNRGYTQITTLINADEDIGEICGLYLRYLRLCDVVISATFCISLCSSDYTFTRFARAQNYAELTRNNAEVRKLSACSL